MRLREPFDSLRRVQITSAAALRTWLQDNHQREHGVALVTFKKHTGDKYVSTSEILDELLCFGWIDGTRCKLDDDRTMQLITPRRTQHWSKTYKERVKRLKKQGRMAQPGLDSVAESKRNGLWTFMDDVDALIVPEDLERGLRGLPAALKNFSESAPSYRRNVLRWIKLAKSAGTRLKRIEKAAEYASRDKRMPQM